MVSQKSGSPAAVGPGPLTDRDKLDYLAAFPTKSRLVSCCQSICTRQCGSAIARGAPRPSNPRGFGTCEELALSQQGRGSSRQPQRTDPAGNQTARLLHHCLSLFIPGCLLTPAQLTWHSGKPNLIFRLREPSDLHHFQADFIKESSMPSWRKLRLLQISG